ncbi:MAG: DUF4350 domain-containing protein [Marmoricola sp.]
MTTLAASPRAAPQGAPTGSSSSLDGPAGPPSALRRHRAAIIVGIALVVATVFAALAGGPRHSGLVDPQNPDPEGAQAIARVLADQGVEVRIVRSAAAFERTRIDADTTVLVSSPDDVGRDAAARLKTHTGSADLVVLDPLFGVDGGNRASGRKVAPAMCDDPRFTGLRIDVEDPTSYADATLSCFRTANGPVLVSPQPHLYVLGSTDLLTNQHVTRADNAAVALRLLGQHDRLVWYVPDPGDVGAGHGVTIGTLLPRWLRPALVLGAVALLALMWWRGRRLGRLVVEPLPVTVSAIESTRSRGRLYRKVHDRPYAAAALRTAARRRLAEQLGLPRRAADDVQLLVRDLAAYTAQDHARLTLLLAPDGPQPTTDDELIRLADDLAELMREVRER